MSDTVQDSLTDEQKKFIEDFSNRRNWISPRQSQFIIEFLVDLNATEAAKRCGYSCPRISGHENLVNPIVREEIDKQMEARAKRTLITADRVVTGLWEVYQRCMQEVPVTFYNKQTRQREQVVDEQGRGVWQFDSAGANKSLETLARHLKLLTDKVDVSGKIDGDFTVTLKDVSDDDIIAATKSLFDRGASQN